MWGYAALGHALCWMCSGMFSGEQLLLAEDAGRWYPDGPGAQDRRADRSRADPLSWWRTTIKLRISGSVGAWLSPTRSATVREPIGGAPLARIRMALVRDSGEMDSNPITPSCSQGCKKLGMVFQPDLRRIGSRPSLRRVLAYLGHPAKAGNSPRTGGRFPRRPGYLHIAEGAARQRSLSLEDQQPGGSSPACRRVPGRWGSRPQLRTAVPSAKQARGHKRIPG